jgi:hypothetical protein
LADSDVFVAAKDKRCDAERVALDKATRDADRILREMVDVSAVEFGTPVSARAPFFVASIVDVCF